MNEKEVIYLEQFSGSGKSPGPWQINPEEHPTIPTRRRNTWHSIQNFLINLKNIFIDVRINLVKKGNKYFIISFFLWEKLKKTYQKTWIGIFLTSFLQYKITFLNSQDENTNSKGGFVLKTRFETFFFRFLVYKHKSK